MLGVGRPRTTLDGTKAIRAVHCVGKRRPRSRTKPPLAFKGGNALRFVYGNLRGTLDLDFTADESFPDDEGSVRSKMDTALATGEHRFGVKLKCQRVRRNASGKTRPCPRFR